MAGCSLRGQRHLAAVLGCLVVALAGSDYLAAVLANDLKTEYLLEQQPGENRLPVFTLNRRDAYFVTSVGAVTSVVAVNADKVTITTTLGIKDLTCNKTI